MNREAVAISWFKKNIGRRFARSSFTRNVVVLAGGAALGQVITVLVSPVLTRLYSPEDFGIFGVYASILGLATVIASLGYEYALPLPEDDDVATSILVLCFLLLLWTTGLMILLVYGFSERVVTWANVPGLSRYLWLIPIGVFGTGTYQILNYWMVRKCDFSRIARTRVGRGISRAAIQVGIGFVHPGPLGLLLGHLAGETAGSVSLGLAVWKERRASFRSFRLQLIYKAGTKYRRFPIFSGSANLVNSLGSQIPQLLLAAFYGAKVAGWFALGQRVIDIPLNIVVDSVHQVYFGEAARLPRDDLKAIRDLFLRLTARLALFGGLPIILICTLASWSFTFVFGADWERAGQYVLILGLMRAVRFIVTPLASTLNILERQELYLLQDGIRLILIAGAFFVAKMLGVSDFAAVGLYGLSVVASTLFFWALIWHVLNTRIRKAL